MPNTRSYFRPTQRAATLTFRWNEMLCPGLNLPRRRSIKRLLPIPLWPSLLEIIRYCFSAEDAEVDRRFRNRHRFSIFNHRRVLLVPAPAFQIAPCAQAFDDLQTLIYCTWNII